MSVKQIILAALKYVVAIGVLWLVLSQIGFGPLLEHLQSLQPLWLVVSFFFFNASQAIASERMRYYYRRAGRPLGRGFCLTLTYISMFYNIVVPGGVGGDTYRIYFLRRAGEFPVGEGIRLQLSNRASGLLALLTIMLVLIWLMDIPLSQWLLALALIVMMGMIVLAYVISVKWLLRENLATSVVAFIYSLGVQLCSVLSVLFLAMGLGLQSHFVPYLVIFLVAAVLSMIPITVGGLGVREFTFFYGSTALASITNTALLPEFGVTLSLAYFCLTVFSSLLGLFWFYKVKQLAQEISPEDVGLPTQT